MFKYSVKVITVSKKYSDEFKSENELGLQDLDRELIKMFEVEGRKFPRTTGGEETRFEIYLNDKKVHEGSIGFSNNEFCIVSNIKP